MLFGRRSRLLAAVVVALWGCSSTESPTTPGDDQVAAVITCPVGNFCGTTNGTLHDGTGNGSLTVVPGDPSPGAPGVWLGDTLAGRWCYANYNSFITDNDKDWLDDDCEYQLAKAFAPALSMSPSDNCPGGEPYWAAKYFDNEGVAGTPGGWGEFIRIAYLPSWYRDCGATSHSGDSEFMMLAIQHNPMTRHWEVREAWLSAHAGTLNSAVDYIRTPGILEYPAARTLSYPRVWLARGKHGFYRSKDECQSRAIINDNCEDNVTMGRMVIYANRNVGSRFVDNFPTGVPSANPLYSQNGRREYYYTSQGFNGWQVPGSGVTPYASILSSVVYECYDWNFVFTGNCYLGRGPSRPAWTYLEAAIEGNTSVIEWQPYTWTSFVTGGTVPYRAEWWQKYASASTATLVATTTGTYSSTFSTAGSWTTLVNRCENFTLTVKVWSTDNQFKQDDHAVTMASCPPPPSPSLSVIINGPAAIQTKATYTYTAVPTGFTSTSYSWAQRFCMGGSCPGWTTLTGFGTSVGRVLGPDCSGNGNNWYEIRVVVRNSDARTATATKQSGLCGGLN
jgi:hypothetical protein